MSYVLHCLTFNLYLGPDNRVHQIFPYRLTIGNPASLLRNFLFKKQRSNSYTFSFSGPEHHPDPDPEAPFKDQEATWVKEPLLTALMDPNLAPAQHWEALSIHNGTISKSGVQAFINWSKKCFEFHFQWFSNNFCLCQVKVQKYSCCDTFFFIEWRKLKIWTKRARIHTCSKIIKRKIQA